jgi:hypothetical protein
MDEQDSRTFICPTGVMTMAQWYRLRREQSTGRPVVPASRELAHEVFSMPELLGLMGHHAAAAYIKFDHETHYTGFHVEELDFRLISKGFLRAWDEHYDAESRCFERWPSLRLGRPFALKSWLHLETHLSLAQRDWIRWTYGADDDEEEEDVAEEHARKYEADFLERFSLSDFQITIQVLDAADNVIFAASRSLDDSPPHRRRGTLDDHLPDEHFEGDINLGFGKPFLSRVRGGAFLTLAEKLALTDAPKIFESGHPFVLPLLFDQLRVSANVHRSDGAIACLVANEPPAEQERQSRNDAEPFLIFFDVPHQARPGRFAGLEFSVEPYLAHPPQDATIRKTFDGTSLLQSRDLSRFADEDAVWRESMRSNWEAKLQRATSCMADHGLQLDFDANGNGTLGGEPCVFEAKGFEVTAVDLCLWLHEDSDIGDDPLEAADVLKALASLPWVETDMYG